MIAIFTPPRFPGGATTQHQRRYDGSVNSVSLKIKFIGVLDFHVQQSATSLQSLRQQYSATTRDTCPPAFTGCVIHTNRYDLARGGADLSVAAVPQQFCRAATV